MGGCGGVSLRCTIGVHVLEEFWGFSSFRGELLVVNVWMCIREKEGNALLYSFAVVVSRQFIDKHISVEKSKSRFVL